MIGLRKPISEIIKDSFDFYADNTSIDTPSKLYALAAHLNILYYLRSNFKPAAYERSEEIKELEKEVHKAISMLELEYEKLLGLKIKCTCSSGG